mgnify:CR=1 FL=1
MWFVADRERYTAESGKKINHYGLPVLMRKRQQVTIIDQEDNKAGDIIVKFVSKNGGKQIVLGFDAEKRYVIDREDIYLKKLAAKEAQDDQSHV